MASDISDGLTSIVNHRIGQYAASLDIRKAYRQIRVSERDAMLRLSVWYDDKQGLVMYKTCTADFGDSQASLALRVAQDKFIASNCKSPLAILASNWPFADNYLMSGRSKQQVLEAILELMELHEKYGMPLKPPAHNLDGVSDILGNIEDTKSNALGLTWDIETDTLQPIFHYHLKGKINGVHKTWEIVGLSPEEINQLVDNMVVSRTVLSKITP